METKVKLDLFRHALEKFIIFNEQEWKIFTDHLSFSTTKKKHHFAVQGNVCDYIGFILSGSVRYYHLKDGTEITGYFSVENELISAYKSFVTRQPCSNNIQMLEETKLILISHQDLQLMYNNPVIGQKMNRFMRLVAEHYLCCYEDRISAFITQTPEERYLEMLTTEAYILQRIPQQYIANYLGITPVSLSRIRNRTIYSKKILAPVI